MYSTTRDSRSVVSGWRAELPFRIADVIEQQCAGAMRALGYLPARRPETLVNYSAPLILDKQDLRQSLVSRFLL